MDARNLIPNSSLTTRNVVIQHDLEVLVRLDAHALVAVAVALGGVHRHQLAVLDALEHQAVRRVRAELEARCRG